MSKVKMNFKGLMAPVFTAFKNTEERIVDYDIIDRYAKFLKSKNVHGVLINGTSGEGMSMSVAERKKTTEIWQESCKKYDISLMVQIGGAPFVDVIELAKHAQAINVDSILCLPELYFKPKTEEDLVDYFQHIAKYCPTIPLLYYHIPGFSGVNLYMPRFLDLVEKSVPNFVGIKYTSGDLDQGSACLKPGRSIFLGADTILCGALALGFDSAIMTTLNICPEISNDIVNLMKNNKVNEANEAQQKLTERIRKILNKGEWVTAMKYEFNNMNIGFTAGPTRKPLKTAE